MYRLFLLLSLSNQLRNKPKSDSYRLNLKNHKEWRLYCKTKKPKNIPSNPQVNYYGNGWNGLADWLGKE